MRLVILLGLGAMIMGSCGDSDPPDEADGTSRSPATSAMPAPTTGAATTEAVEVVDTSTPDTGSTVAGDASVGEELVGRWAHYDVVAHQDDVLKTLIVSFGFNDFSIVDGQLIDQASFCFSEQRTDQPILVSSTTMATVTPASRSPSG